MNAILKKISQHDQTKTWFFRVACAINVMTLCVFVMIVFEIQKVITTTRQVSRDEELMVYLTVLIGVSLIVMIFSQMIISMIQSTLFKSRRSINIRLKMFGMSSRSLMNLYLNEALLNQVVAIPLGLIVSFIVYYLAAQRLEIPTTVLSPTAVFLGITLHCLLLSVMTLLYLRKKVTFHPVDKLRNREHFDGVRQLKKIDIIKFVLGIIMMIASFFIADVIWQMGLAIGALFLLLDAGVLLMHFALKLIAENLQWQRLYFATSQSLGAYKKIDRIITMFIIGVMLSAGLLGLFETLRNVAVDTVEQNLYYDEMIVFSETKQVKTRDYYQSIIYQIHPNSQVAYGINLEPIDPDGVTTTVFAIDPSYLQYGEKMVLVEEDPQFAQHLTDPNFDGIYLPDYFISEKDIGKSWHMTMADQTIPLRIAGRFHANGSRGRYGFISLAYLQQVMQQPDFINSLYLSNTEPSLITTLKEDPNNISIFSMTKADIKNQSYHGAISGTEIFEIAAFVLIIISLLLLMFYFISNASLHKVQVTKLYAMGMDLFSAKSIYLIQTLITTTLGFILGGILAYFFVVIGAEMMLSYVDVSVRMSLPWELIFAIYLVVLLSISVSVIFSLREANKTKLRKFLTYYD